MSFHKKITRRRRSTWSGRRRQDVCAADVDLQVMSLTSYGAALPRDNEKRLYNPLVSLDQGLNSYCKYASCASCVPCRLANQMVPALRESV